jgi:HlyD family secretion protein
MSDTSKKPGGELPHDIQNPQSLTEPVLDEGPGESPNNPEQIAARRAEDARAELMTLLGKGRKKRKKTTIWIGAAALAAAAVAGWLIFFPKSSKTGAEVRYRQYTVQRGNVTAGFTESSSVSLAREQVLFPVSTTVEEVFVRPGAAVKPGDALVRLDTAEIEEGMAVYRLQLEQAKLQLEQAELNRKSKLMQAEQTLESALLEGELANEVQAITAEGLAAKLSSAQKNLEDAVESLAVYRNYEKNYDSDYSDLSVLSRRMKTYETQYREYLTDFDRVSAKELELSYYSTLRANETDDKKITEYDEKIGEIQADIALVSGGKTADQLFKLYEAAFANYTKALERYSDNLSDFNDTYPVKFDDEQAIEKQVEQLRDKVDSYSLAVREATVALKTGSLSSAQKQKLSALASETARAQYNLTALSLSQAVDAAAQVVEQTARQIAEIEVSVSDDGIVRAPISGVVASVAVKAGDSFKVTYNEDTDTLTKKTLLAITDISEVTVPITLSEEDILDIYLGQPARAEMSAFEGRAFAALVDAISPETARMGAAAVSFTVTVRYEGENTLTMFDGMSCQVTLIQKEAADVLYVNNNAVTNTDGIATVQRQKSDGTAETVRVKTGFSNGQMVEIISGLDEGDVLLAPSGVSY